MQLGIYKFKEEFCKELGIPQNQYNRRQKALLEWLKNFFEYEFLPGNPIRIHVKEVIGEYQPLPRKAPKQDELNQQKREKYTTYTIASLGTEFKPNSKAKVARDAISDFGYEEFGHTNFRAVTERYVKKPFEEYGITNDINVWVYYSTYTPMEQETLEEWRKILKEEHISEEEAANAFYRQEQGQDISKEKGYYKKALERFKEEHGDIPILVKEWKLK